MGTILSSVVGAKAAATIGQIAKAKQAYDGFRGGDPGAPQLSDPSALLPPQQQAPDMSSGGLQQGQAVAQNQPTPTPMQDALLGNPQQPTTQLAQNDVQAPTDNPYVADTPRELGGGPVDVVGDQWSPKKENLLGQIGDAILLMKGMKPIFRDRTDVANMESAMQGFQQDPERAIRRMRQVDPATAWKMQEDYTRMQANQELANQRAEARREQGGQMMGGILSSIPNDKTAPDVYGRVLPTLQKMATYYGYDPSLLPDKYDPDQINAMVHQGMNAYQAQRLGQYNKAEQDLTNYRGKRLGQMQQAVDQTGQHYQVEEGIQQQRADKADQQRSVLQTKYGPAEVAPDGKSLILVGPDGLKHKYLNVGPGQWRLFNSEKPKQ